MNPKKVLTLATLMGGVFLFQAANADTSVFFCEKTGARGVSSKGAAADAMKAAEASCKKNKGESCKEIFHSANKGYGSVATGKTKDNKPAFVAVDGFKTKKEAHEAVIKAFKEKYPGAKKPKTITWLAK